MNAHEEDAGLDAHGRAALLRWVDALEREEPAPTDFAERVLAGFSSEQLPDGEPLLPPFVALPTIVPMARRRRLRRWLAAGAGLLAAAVLVLFIGRSLRADVEARERSARIAALEIPPAASLLELRSVALATLQAECTPCHSSSSASAVSGALEVFDVDDPRWYLSMSERQLGVAAGRIEDSDDPTVREGFRAYVDAELAHRRASAPLTSM
jgi:hypothetical protein